MKSSAIDVLKIPLFILKYALIFLILSSIAVAYHEFMHLFTLTALGGKGYIVFSLQVD